MRNSPARAALPLAALALVTVLAGPARAQLLVALEIPRKTYLAYEEINATVTVANRSGADVILSGTNGSNWLTFEVLGNDSILSPLRDGLRQRPMVLRNGDSIVQKLDLRTEYPMSDYGTYRIVASVYYPPMNRYFSSQQLRLEVTKGRTMWNQGFGVARGTNIPVSFREYSLTGFRRSERQDLYVGLKDKQTQRVLAMYPLGRMLSAGDPRATIDTQSRLHVLHLGAPRTYLYSVVDADGELVSQAIFRETETDRPTMMMDDQGVVRIRGGERYDPQAAAAARAAGVEPAERLASELPEGLPQ